MCTCAFFPSQAQVLAVADRPSEAEKLTLEIISKEISCIECYRLLSAIYSKRGNYTEVCKESPLLGHMLVRLVTHIQCGP